MWSTGEGNGKPLQYSCLENLMNSMKRQNDRILKEELPRSVGAQYAEYIMRNAGLEEAQAGNKIAGEIPITSDMQMTPSLWQKVKKN